MNFSDRTLECMRKQGLQVRVVPGARSTGLAGLHGDALKVKVQAPPEGGRANKELCALLASKLGLRAREVEVVQGASSREKVLRCGSLPPAEALQKLLAQP